MNPEYDGAEGWDGSVLQYPGGLVRADRDPWTSQNSMIRGWVGQGKKAGTYLFSTDWTDPNGVAHDFASSYMFRSYNYDYPPDWVPGSHIAEMNYLYPGGVQIRRRFPRPRVSVDGLEVWFRPDAADTTPLPDHAGTGPYPADIVDPTLVTEQTVETWWRYIQGVELRRTHYAYPFGGPHQDYIIADITLTNNGVSGRTPDAPVLAGQTLTGVIWTQAYDFQNKHAEGRELQVWDNHAMYTDPWQSGNSALYWYDGEARHLIPDVAPYRGGDLGDPAMGDYFEGHLLGNAHVMWGPLFVSTSPGQYGVNLAGQPGLRLIYAERAVDFAGKDYSPWDPESQRALIASGDLQMPMDQDYRDDPQSGQWADPNTGDGAQGGTMLLGYGPLNAPLSPANMSAQGWTLGWQESVRTVQMMAGGGLNRDLAQAIGQNWAERRTSDPMGNWLSPYETELIQSGEDTVRKAANLAYWNFHGEFPPVVTGSHLQSWHMANHVTAKPAGYGEFNVPDAPRPPAQVAVQGAMAPMQTGDLAEPNPEHLEICWTTEAESDHDHDTGVMDFSHYRVYRQEGSRLAPWAIVAEGPATSFGLVQAHGSVDFAGRMYSDHDVTGGLEYWYAVTAIDDGSQNWSEPGTPLESSRWWTWTGYAEQGVTAGPSILPPPIEPPVEPPDPEQDEWFLALPTMRVRPGEPTTLHITAHFDSVKSFNLAIVADFDALVPDPSLAVEDGYIDLGEVQIATSLIGDTLRIGVATIGYIIPGDASTFQILLDPISESELGRTIPLTWLPYPETHLGEREVLLIDGSIVIGNTVYGDVSGDGHVSAYDASLILMQSVGLISWLDFEIADVTANGFVSAQDAAEVMFKTLYPDYMMPVEELFAVPPVIPIADAITVAAWEYSNGEWQLLLSDASNIVSGDIVLSAVPDGQLTVNADLSSANHESERTRIAFVRTEPGSDVLLTVPGSAMPEPPEILSATFNGQDSPVAVAPDRPARFALHPAAPNPFNPRTALRFSIAEAGAVRLAVYDANGRWVRDIVDDYRRAGHHSVTWDGTDDAGRAVASGVYVARLTAGADRAWQRMLLVR